MTHPVEGDPAPARADPERDPRARSVHASPLRYPRTIIARPNGPRIHGGALKNGTSVIRNGTPPNSPPNSSGKTDFTRRPTPTPNPPIAMKAPKNSSISTIGGRSSASAARRRRSAGVTVWLASMIAATRWTVAVSPCG